MLALWTIMLSRMISVFLCVYSLYFLGLFFCQILWSIVSCFSYFRNLLIFPTGTIPSLSSFIQYSITRIKIYLPDKSELPNIYQLYSTWYDYNYHHDLPLLFNRASENSTLQHQRTVKINIQLSEINVKLYDDYEKMIHGILTSIKKTGEKLVWHSKLNEKYNRL